MNPLATRRAGLAYGLLGAPLAFVALPLYVLLPDHYAREFGLPLAALGTVLLGVRLLDALIDPWLGRRVDALFTQPLRLRRLAWWMAGVLALAFTGLFFPPWDEPAALLTWGALMLALCSLAYGALTVLHQAWGARLGGDASGRARVAAWREGCALAGVMAASLLPTLAGLGASAAVLALGLSLALALLLRPPWPEALAADPSTAAGVEAAARQTLARHPLLRRLLALYLLNGVASALPATLVIFFVRDHLGAPQAVPALLGLYFGAAALSLPGWVRVVRRIGLLPAWGAGMALALLGFCGAAGLVAGDVALFALICLVCGLAQGADLSVPPALLAGLLRHTGQAREHAGWCFGWWQLTGKLSLALATGLALPLLGALGYQPGAPTSAGPPGLGWPPLVLAYAVLPCVLKLLVAGGLWRLARHPAARAAFQEPA